MEFYTFEGVISKQESKRVPIHTNKISGAPRGGQIFTKVCDTRAVMAEYYPRCREIENIIARGYHSTATTTTNLKYPVM